MNIQALMKQAQQMQKDILKAKAEIDAMVFEGESALVKVYVYGNKTVQKVEFLDQEEAKNDLEMLSDMLVVAFNDAFSKIDKVTEQKMGKYSNSMPGLF
jgi:DNA-binding YbaB/EbfC family protein